ncbi:tyrosine-type recombinase/integrase, partial [Streptococcus pneumoniae]
QSQIGKEMGLTYEKVFSNSFDKHIDARMLSFRLVKHLERAGCPRFTFHAFRHTHASILLNAGLPYKEIQTRLGHAKLSMTMDIYSHLSKDNQKNATSFYEKAIEKLKSS